MDKTKKLDSPELKCFRAGGAWNPDAQACRLPGP